MSEPGVTSGEGGAAKAVHKAVHVRSLAWGLGVAALVVVLDQISKNLILDHLTANPQVIVVAPFLNIVLAWNTGVSFGMFNDGTVSPWLFFGLSTAVSLALAVWMARTGSGARWLILALALIIGGAMGNAIDRVRWGAVFDFIDVHAFGWHWPAFNVADAGITVGAVLLVADSLFRRAD